MPSLAVAIAAVATSGAAAPVAWADTEGIALNGRYSAVSDGVWAKTNDVFHDEAVVSSTWSIVSSCTTYQDCTGRIISDQGWSADLRFRGYTWRVARTVADWEHCADGSTVAGEQTFIFAPARGDDYNATSLTGSDETVAPSGACGINRSLVVRMPLRLTKID
jgi:hypothetical protein